MDYKELKGKLEKIAHTETEEAFTALVLDLPERFDFGFSKASLSLNGKLPLIQAACKHYLVSACMEEIIHFKDGLKRYNVLDILKQYPEESRKRFV